MFRQMRLTPDPTTPFEDVLPKGKPPNKTGAGLAAIISRVVEYDIPGGNVARYFPEANLLIPLNSIAG
mgnify:CR=1 FL=1